MFRPRRVDLTVQGVAIPRLTLEQVDTALGIGATSPRSRQNSPASPVSTFNVFKEKNAQEKMVLKGLPKNKPIKSYDDKTVSKPQSISTLLPNIPR